VCWVIEISFGAVVKKGMQKQAKLRGNAASGRPVSTVDTGDHHLRALLGEGDGVSDADQSTGDQGNLFVRLIRG
jgi:hypothetical protein